MQKERLNKIRFCCEKNFVYIRGCLKIKYSL